MNEPTTGGTPSTFPITTRRTRSEHAEVYLIKCDEFVKIGFSANAQKRRDSLQIGNPYPLTLLAFVKVHPLLAARVECRVHKALAAHAVTGEWFLVKPEAALEAVHQAAAEVECLALEAYGSLDNLRPPNSYLSERRRYQLLGR